MNRSILAVIAAIALTAPAFAMAADGPTMRPKLGGLDLNTPQGAQTAFDRISEAAAEACMTSTTGSRLPALDVACKREMVAQAVRQLRAPRVTALLNGPASKTDRRNG
jgi:UrcA family protein